MLNTTSHQDVSTAHCQWAQPVSTPVYMDWNSPPSVRAVSVSPVTQTRAVRLSAQDTATVIMKLACVMLASKEICVRIWIVQVRGFT